MEAPFDTEFLIRRHTQLLVQAADLPERSSAQAHIEELARKLSDYLSQLADKSSKTHRDRRTEKSASRSQWRERYGAAAAELRENAETLP